MAPSSDRCPKPQYPPQLSGRGDSLLDESTARIPAGRHAGRNSQPFDLLRIPARQDLAAVHQPTRLQQLGDQRASLIACVLTVGAPP